MPVADFVLLTREYIATIDSGATTRPHSLLSTCARLLPRLYAEGLELPDLDPGDADTPDVEIARPRGLRLGRFDGYSLVYDPYVRLFDPADEGPSVMGLLTDDLYDIYMDLARPLAKYDAGRTEEAVWDWKFTMRSHAGDHVVNAMRAIHRAIHDHMPSDFDPRAGTGG
jgi:hypothetical protein